ncbi:MAG: cobT [Pseudonocardiales bacterium]|nr:cobT [Pseudonocardiales bacterium]
MATPGRTTLTSVAIDLDTPDSETEWALRAAIKAGPLPVGALGQLEELAIWFGGVRGENPPITPARVRLVVFAGDHGIRAAGVSTGSLSDSRGAVSDLIAGAGVVNRLAELVDAGVRIVDVSTADETAEETADDADGGSDPGNVTDPNSVTHPTDHIRRGSGRIDVEDALTSEETAAAIALGARIADEEIDSGADLLVVGAVGVGSTTAASTLVCVLTGTEPIKVIGRGAGIDDATWMRKLAAIRDGRFRAMPRRHDLDDVLTAVGGADLAALAGFLLRAAVRRTPVILDGLVTCAAALVVRELDPRATRWWQAAVGTDDPGHTLALERLRLTPITNTSIGMGQGAAALLAVPLLRAAVLAVTEITGSTTDEAAPDGSATNEPAPDESAADVRDDERGLDESGG